MEKEIPVVLGLVFPLLWNLESKEIAAFQVVCLLSQDSVRTIRMRCLESSHLRKEKPKMSATYMCNSSVKSKNQKTKLELKSKIVCVIKSTLAEGVECVHQHCSYVLLHRRYAEPRSKSRMPSLWNLCAQEALLIRSCEEPLAKQKLDNNERNRLRGSSIDWFPVRIAKLSDAHRRGS